MTTIVENEVHSANDDGGAAFPNELALEKKELEITTAPATLDSELGIQTTSAVANDENVVAFPEATVKNHEKNDTEMRPSEDVASSFPEKVRTVPS
jgi:hypothetical protein